MHRCSMFLCSSPAGSSSAAFERQLQDLVLPLVDDVIAALDFLACDFWGDFFSLRASTKAALLNEFCQENKAYA